MRKQIGFLGLLVTGLLACTALPFGQDGRSSSGATTTVPVCSGSGGSVGNSGGTVDCLRFAVLGDTRPGGINDTSGYPTAIITKIYADLEGLSPRPYFATATGDYMFASVGNSDSTTQIGYYATARAQFSNPFFPTMGNHECTGNTNSNCGTGNSSGITTNYTAFMDTLVTPIGQTKPYYSVNLKGTDGSWTAKLVFVAANAWDSTQAAWLTSVLSQPTTYTFVLRHEPTGTSGGPPGLSGSEAIIANYPLTYRLVGHTHTYKNDPTQKQVVIGIGGAPLTGGVDYGYTMVEQRTDGAIQITTYDYASGAVQGTFAIDASGNAVTGTLPTPTPTSSNSPTPTPTSSQTPTPTPTPSGSPTATPTPGSNLVSNGGFEDGITGWTVAGTPMPAASTLQAHSGSDALLLGEPSSAKGGTAPIADSSASQSITIPAGVSSATLTFWYWAGTSDTVKYSWQEALIQNASGTTLATIFKQASNTQTWTEQTVDLTSYAGQTITLYFDVHEDGYSLPSTMFIDDVSVTAQ